MTELCDLLQSLKVKAQLFSTVAKVHFIQTYQNTTTEAVELSYLFPIPSKSQVTGFTAKIGDRTITSEIEETEKAYKSYDDALQKGDSAVILESLRKDIMEISCGNLLPSETAVVTLTYLQELDYTDGSSELTWRIPFVVAPRYDRHPSPESARIQPAIGENSTIIELEAHVQQTNPIRSVSSPSHPIQVSSENDQSIIRLAKANEKADRDFVLHITLDAKPLNHLFTEKDQEKGDFMLIQITPEIPPKIVSEKPSLIGFLLDISGSMDGEKLHQAKQALKLSLRQLSLQDSFNIIAFSSSFYCFQDSFIPYTETALKNADKWIDKVHESGGTEIYQPLVKLLSMMDKEKPGVILLFTDGQVSDEENIIRLVEEHADHIQLFSFGIDTAVNESFIDGIAKAGNGLPEYIVPGERIEDKVLRQLDRMSAPYWDHPECYNEKHQAIELFPPLPKKMFANETYTSLVKTESENKNETIVLKALLQDKEIKKTYRPEKSSLKGILPTWWALEKIRSLEKHLHFTNPRRKLSLKKTIIALSKEYSVLSTLTALIALMPREIKVKGEPNWVRIPVCLPKEWEQRLGFTCGALPDASPIDHMVVFEDNMSFSNHQSMKVARQSPMPFRITEESTLENDIRNAALLQHANGSIGNQLNLLQNTSLFILGILLSALDWQVYKRALIKASQFLVTQSTDEAFLQACALSLLQKNGIGDDSQLNAHLVNCKTHFTDRENKIFAKFQQNNLITIAHYLNPAASANQPHKELIQILLEKINP